MSIETMSGKPGLDPMIEMAARWLNRSSNAGDLAQDLIKKYNAEKKISEKSLGAKVGGVLAGFEKLPKYLRALKLASVVVATLVTPAKVGSEMTIKDLGSSHSQLVTQIAEKRKNETQSFKLGQAEVQKQKDDFLNEVRVAAKGLVEIIQKENPEKELDKIYHYRIVVNNVFSICSERYMNLISAITNYQVQTNADGVPSINLSERGKEVEKFNQQIAAIFGLSKLDVSDLYNEDALALTETDAGEIAKKIDNTYAIDIVRNLQKISGDNMQLRYMEKLLMGPNGEGDELFKEAKENFDIKFLSFLEPFSRVVEHKGTVLDLETIESGINDLIRNTQLNNEDEFKAMKARLEKYLERDDVGKDEGNSDRVKIKNMIKKVEDIMKLGKKTNAIYG